MKSPEMGGRPRHPPGAVLWLPVVGSGNAAAPGENPAQAVVKDWLLAEGLGGQPGLHLELAPYETLTASLLPAQTQEAQFLLKFKPGKGEPPFSPTPAPVGQEAGVAALRNRPYTMSVLSDELLTDQDSPSPRGRRREGAGGVGGSAEGAGERRAGEAESAASATRSERASEQGRRREPERRAGRPRRRADERAASSAQRGARGAPRSGSGGRSAQRPERRGPTGAAPAAPAGPRPGARRGRGQHGPAARGAGALGPRRGAPRLAALRSRAPRPLQPPPGPPPAHEPRPQSLRRAGGRGAFKMPFHPVTAALMYRGIYTVPNLLSEQRPVDIPEDELEEIREAFKVFDRDGNGFISKQELGTAMRSLGYMPNEVELEVIIQRLDMDGDGQVDFEEFVTLLGPKLSTSGIPEKFHGTDFDTVFWKCDMQKLTVDELKRLLYDTFCEHLSMKDIENIIMTEEESHLGTAEECPVDVETCSNQQIRQTCVRKSLICAFAIAFIISVMLIAANQVLRSGMK
ncbi:hypothetical protein R6Z07M_015266 [Ovis aries]